MDCASLKVKSGVVKALFFGAEGKQQAKTVKAGERFNPGPIEGSSSTIVAVLENYRQLLAEGPSQKKPGRKYFDKPENLGMPFGHLYVPEKGLPFTLKGADGQSLAYRLIDDETGKLVTQGTGMGGRPVLIDKQWLQPDRLYRLSVNLSGRDVESTVQIASMQIDDEIRGSLGAIDNDASLDAEDRRLLKALLFEEFALGYNRQLTLGGAI
jgi:hypothetical protein